MEGSASPDPPLMGTYKNLLSKNPCSKYSEISPFEIEEQELPLIDLNKLKGQDVNQKEECKRQICEASLEWSFFQIINHGIPEDLFKKMREEQVKLLKKPFFEKVNNKELLAGSYQWGSPSATCLDQLSWQEAFHVPLSHIYGSVGHGVLGLIMERYATVMSKLALCLAEILSENIGQSGDFFKKTCLPNTCYLRMNRYPPCPVPHDIGIVPHTDSDFLTILHQDDIGGLQLVKDGKWTAVKPYPGALIINIGDLFQAWSNNVYRSIEHRVITNKSHERFSTAYFLLPSYDTIIDSCDTPAIYKPFSFGGYRQQIEEDVKMSGRKIGLSRFLHDESYT